MAGVSAIKNGTSVHDTFRGLCSSIKENNVKNLHALINKSNVSLSTKFNNLNQSLLHFAVLTTNNEEILQSLIDKGLDINSSDIYGQTPLTLAITGRSPMVMTDLVNLRVDLKSNQLELATIVECDSNYQAIRCLLKNQAKTSCDCVSPLHLASYLGDLELINLLLDHGAQIDEKMHNEKTPLVIALLMKHVAVANTLLERGANPLLPFANPPSRFVRTVILPVHIAITAKCPNILPTLAKRMVESGDEKIFNMMVKTEPIGFERSIVPIEEIDNFFKMLTELKLDINAKDEEGRTPLHNFVCETDDWFEVIDIFIKHGADLNATDDDGNTPLHLAFDQSNIQMAVCLMNRWADQSILNNEGLKPAEMIGDETDITFPYKKLEIAMGILRGEVIQEEEDWYDSTALCIRIREELDVLRETKVETSVFNYSLYDVLTVPMHKLVSCVRNRTFIEYFEKYSSTELPQNGHSYYGELIINRFNIARRRYDLLYSNLGAFNELVRQDYPDFVAEMIFHYLSDEDIRNVVKAQQMTLT